MKFTLKHLLIFITFICLYIATWTEGTKHHRAKLEREAMKNFREETDLIDSAADKRFSLLLKRTGPQAFVNTSFAIFPGILVVDSGYTLGRLNGHGGWKIVLYWGFGSTELALAQWRA